MAQRSESLSRTIRMMIYRFERTLDRCKHAMKRWLNIVEPVQILPYRGFGTKHKVMLRGRVLEDKQIGGPKVDDSWWRNLRNMYRRFDSDEIPDVRVRVRFRDQIQETVTDEEGYFEVTFAGHDFPGQGETWQDVKLELLDEIVPGQTNVTAVGQVLVPPSQARFGVISDMDDTVLKTHATNLLRMAKLTFLRNARTRMPFEGVAAFYRALKRGALGGEDNPIFYVSSSAWNIYDLLVDFLDLNDIPAGPLLLKDLGLSRNAIHLKGHEHKHEKINRILTTYPGLPFLLIGDSGQADPKIYRQAVIDHPGRILAVYIRDVVPKHREDVEAIADEVRSMGVEMMLVKNTTEAAIHAAEKGWISSDELPDIQRETDIDDAAKPSEGRLEPV